MRHLMGVVLAIVMAAVVFFAASWGYLKLLIGPAGPGSGALPGPAVRCCTTMRYSRVSARSWGRAWSPGC